MRKMLFILSLLFITTCLFGEEFTFRGAKFGVPMEEATKQENAENLLVDTSEQKAYSDTLFGDSWAAGYLANKDGKFVIGKYLLMESYNTPQRYYLYYLTIIEKLEKKYPKFIKLNKTVWYDPTYKGSVNYYGLAAVSGKVKFVTMLRKKENVIGVTLGSNGGNGYILIEYTKEKLFKDMKKEQRQIDEGKL